jgi:hypothetical protein
VGAAETVIPFPLLLPMLLTGCAFAAAAPAPDAFTDGFDRRLCLGGCRGWNWATSQQIDGKLEVIGGRLRARTEARGERVPKAALIARPAKLTPGDTVRIAFSVMVPAGKPLNSVHLADIECASCGEEGNPGIRLYLRHGRLRIDRAKIGVRDAWTNNTAPQLRHGRWHRVELDVTVGFGNAGRVRARLDGTTVLEAQGDTVVRPSGGEAPGADRIQIGLTASSNPVPALAWFDDVAVKILR